MLINSPRKKLRVADDGVDASTGNTNDEGEGNIEQFATEAEPSFVEKTSMFTRAGKSGTYK